MPKREIKISLDFSRKDNFPKFEVKQFDSLTLNITPLENGVAYSTANCTAKLYIGYHDEAYKQDTDITVNDNNIVVNVDRNILSKEGIAYAEIELTDNLGIATSSTFTFKIVPKIGEGANIPGQIDGFVAKYEKLISEFKLKVDNSVLDSENRTTDAINNVNINVDNKINDIETRFNTLTSEQQKDSEVILARKGETSLKVKIDKIDEQFISNTKEIDKVKLNNANSKSIIRVDSPYATNQATHPKVLYIPSPRLGGLTYNYWMAYTPYENSDRSKENPCIVASVDGYKWEKPEGLQNPLKNGFSTIAEYNSDPHLLYREDTKTLECWYRYVNSDTSKVIIYRRTTINGTTFTDEEVMLETDYNVDLVLSPSIIFEDNKYKMWYCDSGKIYYRESLTGKDWTNREQKNVDNTYKHWHLDVIKTDKGYEFVTSSYISDYYLQDLLYFTSADNNTFSVPVIIMKPSDFGWDNQMMYRATLLKIDNKYKLYYSARSKSGKWGIGISCGEETTSLTGDSSLFDNITVDGNIYLGDNDSWINATSRCLSNGISSFREYPGDYEYSIKHLSHKNSDRKHIRHQVGQIEFANVSQTEGYSSTKNGTIRFNDMLNIFQQFKDNKWQHLNTEIIDTLNNKNNSDNIINFEENKITITKIDSTHPSLNQFPENSSGILVTDRTSLGSGFAWQYYHCYNSNKKYMRYAISGTAWSSWSKIATRKTYDFTGSNQTVNANSILEVTVSCDGVLKGDSVTCYPYSSINNIIWSQYVSNQNEVTIRIYNMSSSNVTLSNILWKINVVS